MTKITSSGVPAGHAASLDLTALGQPAAVRDASARQARTAERKPFESVLAGHTVRAEPLKTEGGQTTWRVSVRGAAGELGNFETRLSAQFGAAQLAPSASVNKQVLGMVAQQRRAPATLRVDIEEAARRQRLADGRGHLGMLGSGVHVPYLNPDFASGPAQVIAREHGLVVKTQRLDGPPLAVPQAHAWVDLPNTEQGGRIYARMGHQEVGYSGAQGGLPLPAGVSPAFLHGYRSERQRVAQGQLLQAGSILVYGAFGAAATQAGAARRAPPSRPGPLALRSRVTPTPAVAVPRSAVQARLARNPSTALQELGRLHGAGERIMPADASYALGINRTAFKGAVNGRLTIEQRGYMRTHGPLADRLANRPQTDQAPSVRTAADGRGVRAGTNPAPATVRDTRPPLVQQPQAKQQPQQQQPTKPSAPPASVDTRTHLNEAREQPRELRHPEASPLHQVTGVRVAATQSTAHEWAIERLRNLVGTNPGNLGGEQFTQLTWPTDAIPTTVFPMVFGENGRAATQEPHRHNGPRRLSIFTGPDGAAVSVWQPQSQVVLKILFPPNSTHILEFDPETVHAFSGGPFAAVSTHLDDALWAQPGRDQDLMQGQTTMSPFPDDAPVVEVQAGSPNIPGPKGVGAIYREAWLTNPKLEGYIEERVAAVRNRQNGGGDKVRENIRLSLDKKLSSFQANETIREIVRQSLSTELRVMQDPLQALENDPALARQMQGELEKSGEILRKRFSVLDVMRAYRNYAKFEIEDVIKVAKKVAPDFEIKEAPDETLLRVRAAIGFLAGDGLWPIDRRLVEIFAPEYVQKY